MTSTGYRDYFKILGVDRNANQDVIKQAFRRLARKYHPDVNPGDSDAEARFKEVGEAYEVLSDPEKRSRYEQFGQYWNQSPGFRNQGTSAQGFDVDFGRYGNFDEFISELLGKFTSPRGHSGFSAQSGFPSNPPRKSLNLDAVVELKIGFSDAFKGTERTLSVNEEKVKVRIPNGIKSGSKLRLKGKGNLQPGTGKRGDLYLNIKVEPHPIWLIDGGNLKAYLPVAFDELILGGNITVLTPDGEAQLTIPPGTLPGQSLRLKGKGWPLRNGRGDLIFTLNIDFPEELSPEELNLLEELKRIRCNDPRKAWLKSARL